MSFKRKSTAPVKKENKRRKIDTEIVKKEKQILRRSIRVKKRITNDTIDYKRGTKVKKFMFLRVFTTACYLREKSLMKTRAQGRKKSKEN